MYSVFYYVKNLYIGSATLRYSCGAIMKSCTACNHSQENFRVVIYFRKFSEIKEYNFQNPFANFEKRRASFLLVMCLLLSKITSIQIKCEQTKYFKFFKKVTPFIQLWIARNLCKLLSVSDCNVLYWTSFLFFFLIMSEKIPSSHSLYTCNSNSQSTILTESISSR